MRLPLLSLAQELPARSAPYETLDHDAIVGKVLQSDGYIWPELEVVEEAVSTPVLLVSAPGAMGKSEAARSLAAQINAPYVNLAQLHVGRGSLIGELVKAFGSNNAEEFRQDVQAGRAALVLDSTDEAQLRSGAENYLEFLKDLEWLLNLDVPHPQLVVFGRSDSIEITEVALRLIGVPASSVQLAPLNIDSAGDLIGSILDATDYELHRTQPEPFERLRDLSFENMAESLLIDKLAGNIDLRARWELVEGFLGYPPVLKALAERLRVKNPQLEIAAVGGGGAVVQRRQRGSLLRGIIETILDREASKVRTAIGKSLGLRDDDQLRQTLYTRDEQAARLLAFVGVRGIDNLLPAHLDASERSRYEELISPFVADHPFIRRLEFSSIVFSDYLRAWAVSAPTGIVLTPTRAPFLKSLPQVGPFFAMFLSALAAEVDDVPTLPEDLVDDAIRSNSIGAPQSLAMFSHFEGLPAQLRLIDADPRLASEEIVFSVDESSGVLVLTGPLARISVVSQYGVILKSGPSGTIEFGPDALIIAEEIELDGKGIQVFAGDSSMSGLIAKSSAKHDADFKVLSHEPGAFIASWPDAWHQWSDFTIAPAREGGKRVPQALGAQVIIAVRKLLLAFHKTSVEKPAVSADKLDRVLVGGNEVAATVRDVLIDMTVVYKDGSQYYLDLSKLGTFGVSWSNLRGSDPYATLRSFSEAVVNTEIFISRHLAS